jgi:acetoin utilization protein AcuA
MFEWTFDQAGLPPIIEEVSTEFATPRGPIKIQMPAPAELIESLDPDPGIEVFHPPVKMQRILARIARSLNGAALVAYRAADRLLVGYIAFHPPDARIRWGRQQIPNLWELEVIEVSAHWRGLGIGRQMLTTAFQTHFFDEKIVISTEYAWHWDLGQTGLTKAQYRQMLLKLFERVGFQEFATDEPNITADPANIFMARVGRSASPELVRQFTALLKTNNPVRYTITIQGAYKRFKASV